MSAKELLELAKREEWISIEVLARVLGESRRRVLRDARHKGVPMTRVGRAWKMTTDAAVAAYYPKPLPATSDHLNHSDASQS